MSIPKVIHYCWFGNGKMPAISEKCIKSWKKYCPDYEIVEWNETNFPPTFNDYVKEAYEAVGMKVIFEKRKGEWFALVLKHN